jgi:hypothetical protein
MLVAGCSCGGGVVVDAGTDAPILDYDTGPCPDITGRYAIAATGACGDLGTMPMDQRIDGSTSTCTFYAEVESADGVASGPVAIARDGSFSGATVMLGTSTYTCDAAYAPGSVTLTCTMGASTCTVSMTRTGPL